MAMLNGQTQVVNGPSREELFDALRLCSEFRTVEFELIDGGRKRVRTGVVMLKPEDGSGTKWLLDVLIGVQGGGKKVVSGYYDTASRTGYFNLS